jgi:peptidoglycan/LPS O-acetylase OafA/YrhL
MTSGVGERIYALDVLRGVAALSVAVFHYSTRYPELYPEALPTPFHFQLGYYGVHLFFMISGFVILMSLDRSDGKGFVRSRFIRLFPLYWASVALTSVILLATQGASAGISWMRFLANLTMFEDYLKVEPIDGVYWSLSYELGFYILMLVVFRAGFARFVPALPVAFSTLAALFIFAKPYLPHPFHYLLVFHAFGHLFACGVALYLIKMRGFRWDWAAIIASAPFVQLLHDGPGGIFPVAVAAGLMIWAVFSVKPLSRWTAALTWFGAISYALYLTHQMIGYALMRELESRGLPAGAAMAAALLVAIGIAAALTHGVDEPARRALKKRLFPNARADRQAKPAAA